MNTNEFMELLQNNEAKELLFQFPDGRGLPAGYHFTEVKNVSIDSVDCGGAAGVWKETVIQLWLPATASHDRAMSGSKALGILKKVDSIKPMDAKAPCRFEVEESGVTVIYDVAEANATDKALTIRLTSQKTQCKAQKRDATACGGSAEASSEESCCSPTQKTKSGACC
jgi:hypothetical protein